MDELIQFAKNGHTSVEMLQKHYLNQMNLEKATKRARAIIPEGKMQGMLTALNSKNSPIEQQAVLDEYVFKMNEEILQSKRTEAFPEKMTMILLMNHDQYRISGSIWDMEKTHADEPSTFCLPNCIDQSKVYR